MTRDNRSSEFKFTYRSMVVGALIGLLTYAIFKDVPSIFNIVKYGTWLAIAPISLLMVIAAPVLRRRLSAAALSRVADVWLETVKVLVGHGLMFGTLAVLHPF